MAELFCFWLAILAALQMGLLVYIAAMTAEIYRRMQR